MDYFFYNTDARSLVGPPLPRFPILIARSFAALGGDRTRFGEQFGKLHEGDVLLMYENMVGIVATGRVIGNWNGKSYRTPWYYNSDEMSDLTGGAYEYRIAVDWFLDLFNEPVRLADLRRRIGSPSFTPRGAVRKIAKGRDQIEAMIARFKPASTLTPRAFDLEPPTPERVETTTYRILRDTAKTVNVKRLHNYECQVCGQTIELPDGKRYAEAHHIKALGRPHDGPDVTENILCLCPNHHAELDYGASRLRASKLRCANGHVVAPEYVVYHNRKVYRANQG